MEKLFGKTIVITGATSGIGFELSMLLLSEGANVYMVGRDFKKLKDAVSKTFEKRSNVNFIHADITKDSDVKNLLQKVDKEEKIDILIHGAGVISIAPLIENPVENLDDQYKVNVRAPYLITQKLLPKIIDAKGEIIFLNSTAGIDTWEGQSQYSATKYALRAIADSLRKEMKKNKVKVQSIYLGGTATPMQEYVQEAKGNQYDPDNFIAPKEIAQTIILELQKSKSTMITDMTIRSNI